MRIVGFSCLMILFVVFSAGAVESWKVVTTDVHEGELAVEVAIDDLREAGVGFDLAIDRVSHTQGIPSGNCIILGASPANPITQLLKSEGFEVPALPDNPEGCAIATLQREDARIIVIAGASIQADVYGLYWIYDRLRVNRFIPEINTLREPIVEIRLGGAWGRNSYGGSSEEQLRSALRYGFNWVAGPNMLDLIPWDADPEREENEKHRERARKLIEYAHALHIKFYAFSNEFTVHPSLLEAVNATLDPCDPAFWEAVKEKYRLLFQGLPELDGISVCNDDISGFWDRYVPFDLTREAPECDWPYTKRFHAFVKATHDVVVKECNKTYFHFTWGLREHEIHCQPEVFRAIFTDDIPTDDIYLMPKITRGDRWWFQPYNATFNQTPHNTVVLFETMNCYEGRPSHIFPTFSGDYFQRGLQTFMEPDNSNVRGMGSLAGGHKDDWGTTGAYAYVLYRLMWDRDVSMDEVTRDFCAIHFGEEAADIMASAYRLTAGAYKYGLHVEPISYGSFNSFTNMRVNIFTVEGYPAIDNGEGHLNFLRRMYLRCDPWRKETLRSMEQGLDAAREIRERVEEAGPLIEDKELAAAVSNRAAMTFGLINTNLHYMDTVFAFFDYWDEGNEKNRDALEESLNVFDLARNAFAATPNFGYQLDGVDVLRDNAHRLLDDREEAMRRQETTPDEKGLERIIAEQQQRYEEILKERSDDLLKLGLFEVLVDGQDMLEVKGDGYKLIPIKWDAGHAYVAEITAALPEESGTVILKNIESRPMHPFVLEQPSPENEYTVRIYLNDLPGGQDWMKFELYYLSDSPKSLGIEVPWGGDRF
ncbi:MAG: hypothetical protein GX117_11465 [Candidatus Hydrogenedentes bacterium]|nr:hypothetical protein [Candidatus Hydrogenedentota bacterium]